MSDTAQLGHAARSTSASQADRGMTRRQFHGVAAASLALATGKVMGHEPISRAGWIDAHVHVWTPDVDQYPLAEGFTVEQMAPRSFTPDELFAHSQPSGVDRIVLIQMSYYRFDNSYMIDVMREHPDVFAGVAIVDHRRADVVEQMRELAEHGVTGFRIHPRGDEAAGWVDDDGMNRVWSAAADEGLAICPLINPSDIVHVDSMCQKHSATTVVVDHFARIGIDGTIDSERLDELCRLARFENTHVKTSAFYALGKKAGPYEDLVPLIRRVGDAFGAERLMWASDCPFQVQGDHDYETSIALIRDRIDFLSENEKENILRDTAARIYFRD